MGPLFRSIVGTVSAMAALLETSEARPVIVPFDFSRSAILLEASVRETPLHMFFDTGVNPSAIDGNRAKSLGLKIDYAGGGEASGDGNAEHVIVYPTSIDDLAVGGRRFGAVEALTVDMKAVSNAYGRPVDGTLGYSFLVGKLLLVDYPAETITIFDEQAEAASQLSKCRKVWRAPLRSFKGDHIPIVELKIGQTRLPVSVDTGSNGSIELYKKALDNPAVIAALAETGTSHETGSRGVYTVKVGRLNVPISLGPFTIPSGQTVTLSSNEGSLDTRLANVGNKLFANFHIKLLLDYRKKQIGFFGDCAH